MFGRIHDKLWEAITTWLTTNLEGGPVSHRSDYERMRHEIRPADVVLVEGHGRISNIIKTITLSNWTHSALYIGRLHDIEDTDLREYIAYHYDGEPGEEPLVIESLLEAGTIVASLSRYKDYHVRVCRPKGLSHADAEKVVRYCVSCLSLDYDVRQLLDLARFMFPFYSLLPRRWRSSLFQHNTGMPTRMICSTMIAEAFHEVNFPILPLLVKGGEAQMSLQERNARLFTPADFDYSPYFEIIKYPMFAVDELAIYRKLPWDEKGRVYNEKEGDVVAPKDEPAKQAQRDRKQGKPAAEALRNVFDKSSA